MRHALVSDIGADRLLLIFAGWGMDANVFGRIARPGYDVMVVWDYNTLYIDWSCTARYCEIVLVAWSLGVYAATQTTQAIDYKITRRVAVNGTPSPIHDACGIPEATFMGTLEALTPATLGKFYRRMCSTRDDYARFIETAPAREVDDLRSELQSVADSLLLNVPGNLRWDVAIVGREDRIFPPANQRRYWAAHGVAVENTSDGHYLDFQQVIDKMAVDKVTMASRFGRHRDTYTDNAVVQTEVVDRMVDETAAQGIFRRLTRLGYRPEILEIGSGSGLLTRRLVELLPDARLELWDLAGPAPDFAASCATFRQCDAELQLPRMGAESLDAVFSASTMQWFNSPEQFMRQLYRVLRPDGVAVLSTYTYGNMQQISALTGRSLPLERPDRLLDMARSAGLAVDYSLSYIRDLDFESPADVLRHLRLTGVNSLGATAGTARSLMRRYPMMLDGRYHLTYCPMILILRRQ